MIDDSASHSPPSQEELNQWNKSRKNASSRGAGTGPPTAPRNLDEAALNKRLERQRRKKLQETSAELENEEPINAATPSNAPSSSTSKEISYLLTIPAMSKDLPWYKPKKYNTLLEARQAGIWNYPQTLGEAAKCAVFYDLWKKGNFMGNGLRFGGDWLVYPGRFIYSNLPD